MSVRHSQHSERMYFIELPYVESGGKCDCVSLSSGVQQCFVVFDVLMINDNNLANCPLRERADHLKKWVGWSNIPRGWVEMWCTCSYQVMWSTLYSIS